MEESNERWKTDGDCSKCRRKLYCGKDCKAAVNRLEKIAYEIVQEKRHSSKTPIYEMVQEKLNHEEI